MNPGDRKEEDALIDDEMKVQRLRVDRQVL